MQPPTILITGATGSQGGATAHALLSHPAAVKIHALVRDPASPASLALQAAGATLFPGTYDSPPALAAACAGCSAVFINTMPSAVRGQELQHAENIVSAALASGTVEHLLYSSVQLAGRHFAFLDFELGGSGGGGGDDGGSFMATYWDAKNGIEERVRKSGLKWTILRPAFLMKNMVPPGSDLAFPELGTQGVLLSAFRADIKLTLLAEGDVGAFAARALLYPEEGFIGREITLGAQSMGLEEIAGCLSEVVGKEVQVKFRTEEEVERLKRVHPIVESQVLSNKLDFGMDFEGLKKYGIKLTTFKEYLEGRKEDVRKGYTF